MQYREQGDKIQVLKYVGYNKEKRRAEVKMLGSFDKYTFKQTDGLLDGMTDDEKKEFTVKLQELKQSAEESNRQSTVNHLTHRFVMVNDCLTKHGMTFDLSKISADEAASAYAVMKAFAKALEDAGHKPPKRPYKAKKALAGVDESQLAF